MAEHAASTRPERARIAPMYRRVAFVLIAGLLAGCSASVAGDGSVALDAPVPVPKTPSASLDPDTLDPDDVSRAVDLRQSDLPAGWKPIPGDVPDSDSAAWAFWCVRHAGQMVGVIAGTATPDFSPDGTRDTNQVQSVTGVFPDVLFSSRFVDLFRQRSFGACIGAEAAARLPETFGSAPTFVPLAFVVAGLEEASALEASTTTRQGSRVTLQLFVLRRGPVVTMLTTYWQGDPDSALVDRVARLMADRLRSL
jgi:hypothetical protein